jgi:hypothetical protein
MAEGSTLGFVDLLLQEVARTPERVSRKRDRKGLFINRHCFPEKRI